jgi:hypothetical protein
MGMRASGVRALCVRAPGVPACARACQACVCHASREITHATTVPAAGVVFSSPSGATTVKIQTSPTFTMGAGGLGGLYPNAEIFGLAEVQGVRNNAQLVRTADLNGGTAYIAEYRYTKLYVRHEITRLLQVGQEANLRGHNYIRPSL